MTTQDYIRDGAAIYARSFSIIRAEADLARFTKEEERVAVRIIHACGMVEVARHIVMSPTFANDAAAALRAWRGHSLQLDDGRARHNPRPASG